MSLADQAVAQACTVVLRPSEFLGCAVAGDGFGGCSTDGRGRSYDGWKRQSERQAPALTVRRQALPARRRRGSGMLPLVVGTEQLPNQGQLGGTAVTCSNARPKRTTSPMQTFTSVQSVVERFSPNAPGIRIRGLSPISSAQAA